MNKRRRTSSAAGKSVDEDASESDSQSTHSAQSIGVTETPRKRRKLDPNELLQNLYDTLRNSKKEDGTLLCDAFIRVPKRRQEPAYYDVVSSPIDLLKVQQKLKTEEYDDIEDFQADVELLVNNAKAFYKKSSQEYKDAQELWELFNQTKTRLFEGNDENSVDKLKVKQVGKTARRLVTANTSGGSDGKRQECLEIEESSTESWATNTDDEINPYEDLFSSIMTASDQDSRPLHLVFQLLPSKKRYPEYYNVIESPIDLRGIARKIQDGKYLNLNEMETDLLQMTKNACIFNEPGSQIYKDAKALKRIITSRKIEIEHSKSHIEKKSERIRNKRLKGAVQSLSAITAALKSESENSSDGEEDADSEQLDDPENPRWQLYNAVRSYEHEGMVLSESFMKLPSKRYYPSYYHEIKNPISLLQINKKLSNGEYGTVIEVAGDLNILFENTKKYNKPDTKFYKDVVILQKVMQDKVHELLDSQLSYSDSEDETADENTMKKALKPGLRSRQQLRKRLSLICKCLMDYTTEVGRQPLLMFMEKPSKRIYPDYYKIITEPMDVITIVNNIKNDKYASEEDFLKDFRLMFRNCRKYNEEGSLIYEDALLLEKLLAECVNNNTVDRKTPIKIASHSPPPNQIKPKKGPNPPTPTMMKMRTLFNTIKDYKDPKDRQLSVIFNRLPSKVEYPDYYEVIKKPINLEIISQKLKVNCYENLDELFSDFILMFDNACKYNEPDSQIYKDALVLQRVTLQTKLQLREDEDTVPDVPAAVQELLTSLFTAVYNHQDEEGRCFSDSMAELSEHDEVNGKKVRALSLDLIKRRLNSGQYKRLDMFQDDMFLCLERARQLSRTDSQVFEDSIELQTFFIRMRDELCRNGDLLNSPALNYSLLDLSAAVNEVRDVKQEEEQLDGNLQEEEITLPDNMKEANMAAQSDENSAVKVMVTSNQQVYQIGDFVYAEPKERGMEPIILNILRMWINQEGQQMIYGNQYYRPSETYHVTTRKFLEKEVFKTEQHIALPLSHVRGKCALLTVKDYFRYKPEGFDDKDVYVCESRYSCKARSFKKIKSWPHSITDAYKLIEREEPLEPKRNVSVYRDRVEKHKEEIAELEGQERMIEKPKPNVVAVHLPADADPNITYYEQYNAPNCLIKTGDCVYLKDDENKDLTRTLICQIDKIWEAKSGEGLIHGPWFVLPSEIPSLNRLVYKQEIFLSTLETTNRVEHIVGKCGILEHSEYISFRPTEIPESEIYICESMLDEDSHQVVDLPKGGVRKYAHSASAFQDEIYFFRRLINPMKVNTIGVCESVNPPQNEKMQVFSHQYEHNNQNSLPNNTSKMDALDIITEDSCDGRPPSVCSSDMGAPSTPTNPLLFGGTQSSQNSRRSRPRASRGPEGKSKLVTGYILYSSDVRRAVTQNNPLRTFGEVSRIVGNEWKKLSPVDKNMWEERAGRINDETMAKMERELQQQPTVITTPIPNNSFIGPQLPDHVWECMWDNCDWMFEDQADCLEHAIAELNGHVASSFAGISSSEAEYQCQWKACQRLKKQAPPFPSLHRLIRHVKEVHITKSPGRVVPLHERSNRRVVPSRFAKRDVGCAASLANHNYAMHSASPSMNSMLQARSTPSPHFPNIIGVSSANNTMSGNSVTVTTIPSRVTPEPDLGIITVPPRPQKVIHSDIYLKYIQGLSSDSRYLSNWQRQLTAQKKNVPVSDETRLPTHWLANGAIHHGTVLDALWCLRDFMLQDALNISKSA